MAQPAALAAIASNQCIQHIQEFQERWLSGPEQTFTTRDLSRKSGDIIAEALRHPVTITQSNKPRLVLLNIEDYRRLKAQADNRQVGTIDTLPDAFAREIEAALDAYAEGDEAAR